MASKRKMRKFGAPPEVHEKAAGRDARRATKLARAATKHAHRGHCGEALGFLVNAASYAGAVGAEGAGAVYGKAAIGRRGRRALRIGLRADGAVERARAAVAKCYTRK